ncbi:hypothetical protein BgiMline_010323 [Biomphalaria glabrata]|nr:hypothetical protein BgiMline_024057 [Biomphalaria glabrata]
MSGNAGWVAWPGNTQVVSTMNARHLAPMPSALSRAVFPSVKVTNVVKRGELKSDIERGNTCDEIINDVINLVMQAFGL